MAHSPNKKTRENKPACCRAVKTPSIPSSFSQNTLPPLLFHGYSNHKDLHHPHHSEKNLLPFNGHQSNPPHLPIRPKRPTKPRPQEKTFLPLPQHPIHLVSIHFMGQEFQIHFCHWRLCGEYSEEMVGLGLVLDLV